MKRVIIAGTIAFLIAIVATTALGQDSLLQAFISTDPLSQTVRIVLVGLLVTLLLISSPRSLEFRSALSMASALLSVGVAFALSQNHMAVIDAVLFIEVAIIFGLESIESPELAKGVTKTKAHSV